MKINLLIIATSKYTQFLPELLKSVANNFCKDSKIRISVFTDKIYEVREQNGFSFGVDYFQIEHHPWPGSTLYRFHHFNKWKEKILDCEYYFYIDADTLIKSEIKTEEIIGERVGTQHCGFIGKRGSYEGRPTSASYVSPDEGINYFGGGFWGFSKIEFWKAVDRCIELISIDAANGITPEHNDESVINRYFIDNPPTKILTPSFHYPMSEKNKKSWKEKYPCKILLLDKDHKTFQI